MRRPRVVFAVIAVLLFLVIVIALVWINVSLAHQLPGGRDFLANWTGARAFLFGKNDPYGVIAGSKIQLLIYGRMARPGEYPYRPQYPFYILFLYFPFALIADPSLARGLWMMASEIALAGVGLLSLRLSEWRPRRILIAAFILFSIFWFYGTYPLLEGDAVIMMALVFVGALLAIRSGLDELAGALLALSTFKWEVGGLFLLFVLVWTLSHRRWRVVAGFLMALFVMLGIAAVLYPDWLLAFLRAVVVNLKNETGLTPGDLFVQWWPDIGRQLGWTLTIILAVILLLEWRAARGLEFRRFFWTACLTLTITPLLGIRTTPINYIVLLLPLTLILAIAEKRWQSGKWYIIAIMLMVFVGPWALFWQSTIGHLNSQDITMFLPLPVLVLIGLYWIRWWIIHPPRTWLDDVTQDKQG